MAVSYANEQKWNDFLKAHGIRVLEADRWAGEHMMSWSDFAHHHPLGSMAHDDYLPLFADFFRSRSPGARRMTNAQIARLMRQHKQANPYIRDQDDSRAKAEAAYERADRAYTKAVLTYGGFDVRTVAAYRRRQKAEQALHAILRRNPGDYEQRLAQAEQGRGQLFRSLRGKTKQELLGILSQQYRIHGMSAKDSITDLKYAITSAAFPDPRPPRRNPASKRSQLSSLNRRIAAAERAGMPVAYLMEQRDLLLLKRGKKRNPDVREGWYADDRPSAADRKEIGKRIDAVIREIPKHPKANVQLMGYLPQILRDLKYSYNDGGVTRSYVSKVLLDAMQEIRRAEGEKIPRRNPGLTPAGKKHLIQTMHKAGADTFKKKVAYVRRHIPNVTDPQAFVGYVMAGERKGKRR